MLILLILLRLFLEIPIFGEKVGKNTGVAKYYHNEEYSSIKIIVNGY